MAKLELDAGHEWLGSDGKVLGRLVSRPVNGGIELTLGMPEGEPVVAIVEKMDIAAANNFCELVRGVYVERKESKRAASAERHADIERDRQSEPPADAEVVSLPKESVQIDFMDQEAVANRCRALANRLSELGTEIVTTDKELDTLYKILGVLQDASQTDGPEPRRVLPAEEAGDRQGVDNPACSPEVPTVGAEATSEISEGVEDEDSNSGE